MELFHTYLQRYLLVFGVLALLWGTGQGNNCNLGFVSTGWISPADDLHIEVGKSWEMFCVLNTSHPDAEGGSWKNLSFYVDNKLARYPMVQKHNETAIRLYVENATTSPHDPGSDYYSVSCKQNFVRGICVRHVYVGYPPLNVTDFQCTSYNWERLECTWHEPYNPIVTTYSLSYQVLFRSRRMTTSCPVPPFQNPSIRFLAREAANASGQQGSCEWNLSSSPQYFPTAKSYNFSMAISNDLNSTVQYLGLVDHYSIVIPNKMENLSNSDIQPRSATISWKVPPNLQLFPPGLEFRVAYQTLASWVDPAVFNNIPEAGSVLWKKNDVNYSLNVSLPYANTKYSVSIWARSKASNASDERFWSQPATMIFQTSADYPCSGPEALPGSFQVEKQQFMRTATIRWSRLPAECENGPGAGYEITVLDSQQTQIQSRKITSTDITKCEFGGLSSEKTYKFQIRSFNEVGYSPSRSFNEVGDSPAENSSEVFLPMESTMPKVPENIMRVVYNDTFFGIQWTPSQPSRGLSMAAFGHVRSDDKIAYPRTLSGYTVFWCKSLRDSPVECDGRLYNQEVPPTATSLNVTLPDVSNYQFAVEANQGEFSSGMDWSSCIVMANGNGSQVTDVKVVTATTTSLEISWRVPCSNGIITAFNIYYCAVVEDFIGDEEANCLVWPPRNTTVDPTLKSMVIGGLEPYTMYKIVMSVQTQIAEGPLSDPALNRTSEGKPSPPLDLNVVEVTNQSLSISWRAPLSPNGPSPYYNVFRHGDSNSMSNLVLTEATMAVESYTRYNISVQACNSPTLCSEQSVPISVLTQIGVPSAPSQPSIKTSTDNSSCIEIRWSPPSMLAGPTYLSIINITGGDNTFNFTAYGNATERLIESSSVCQPSLELKIRVRTVNQAEKGELLMGPWSVEGEYQCKSEGLTLRQILIISFSVALLVLVIVLISYILRRWQVQKSKARETDIILPWEKDGNNEISSAVGNKQVGGQPKDISGLAFNSVANYYGRLDHNKMDRIGGSPPVIDMKKLRTVQEDSAPTEADCSADRESRSSGHSSGQDSFSCYRASQSELSNSDSGAELEAPNSPSPDVFVNPPSDPFAKPLAIVRSSQNVADVSGLGDVDRVQYSAVQLRESQRNGSSAPDLAQPLPNPYVRVGMAPSTSLVPAQSVGYVTLGPSQLPDSAVSSPNASPNLSVGSNESLIVKSERDTRPTVKIVPLKRNSGGGSSGGYVEACIVEPASDLRASSSPGYVAFKSQEPVELDRPTVISPVSPPQTNGYVTLGANSAGAAPTANATSTHYVKMGPQTNVSLSYV